MASQAKSRTKSGSSKKTKISTKVIAAIIVGIVAIAGIVIVFNSFASGPPAYQYSYNATCEKKSTNINVKTNQIVTTTGTDIVTVPVDPKSDCVKNSAEAMAFRLYQTVYGKTIDYNTYKSYVQKLAGDRTAPQLLIPDADVKDPADLKEFVKKMYKNALGRTPSDSEVNGWVNNINNGKIERQSIAFLFASSAEAGTKNSGPFAAFIKANPTPVTVTPAAQNQQNARATQAQQKADRMKVLNDEIASLKNAGIQIGDYASAKVIADQVSKDMIESKKLYDEIDGLYNESTSLTQYASNISNTAIKNTKVQADQYLKQSWANAVAMGSYTETLKNSGASSSIAAGSSSVAAARRQATGCNLNLNSITRSSGSACIKKIQQAYGLKADGVWGPATQAKVCSIRKNCAPNSNNSNSTATPRVSDVPIDNGGAVTRVPNNSNINNIPTSSKPTNSIGTSMCRKYKNGKPGTYTDYEYKKAFLFLYRQNTRKVTCFNSSNGFVGNAGAWRGWSNPIYTANKQVGNTFVHARECGLY